MSANPQYIPTPTRPASCQLNFRQMQGEVQSWNPDCPPQMVARYIQNAYRRLLDDHLWYGLYHKGLLTSPNIISSGTVTVTNGSTTVTGTGTGWTADPNSPLDLRQFRTGFMFPAYNIVAVPSATQLTLDQPWGDQTLTNVGYQIYQSVYTLGPNMKYLKEMVNQMMGFRMKVYMGHPGIVDSWDSWRSQVGWTYLANSYPSITGDGQLMCELYPPPYFIQSFPFLAYLQPPDLVADIDCPIAWLRSDVIVLEAIADVLVYRGRSSKYYDSQTALYKKKEAEAETMKMRAMDYDVFSPVLWDFYKWPLNNFSADWWSQHSEVPAYTTED